MPSISSQAFRFLDLIYKNLPVMETETPIGLTHQMLPKPTGMELI